MDRRAQRGGVLIWVVIIGSVWWAIANHPAPPAQATVTQRAVVCPQAGTVDPQHPSVFAECQPVQSR